MTEPTQVPGADDQRLFDELARLVRERDPVPPELVQMAQESFTWRTIDAELAELVADSYASAGATLVRSGQASVRLLTFAVGGLRLELEVLADRASRRLVGELLPGHPARITVEHPEGSLAEDTDELGRFIITGVPGGRVRVRCVPTAGPALVTPWLEI
jgi:hypothetical protein